MWPDWEKRMPDSESVTQIYPRNDIHLQEAKCVLTSDSLSLLSTSRFSLMVRLQDRDADSKHQDKGPVLPV